MRKSLAFVLLIMGHTAARAELPLTPLVFSDDPAPGFVPNLIFDQFVIPSGSSDGRRFAFGGFLEGVGVTGDSDTAAYAGLPASLGPLAREGAPPDLGPSGVYFTFLNSPSINASGTCLFYGNLSTPGYFGMYRRTGSGTFETLAETAFPIDGATDRFLGSQVFGNRCAIDGAGRGYFVADLTGSNVMPGQNNYGIFRAAPGSITTLVRSGTTQTPGVPDPLNITRFSIFTRVNANASGEYVFAASLSNTTSGENSGIWTTTPGALTLLARKGAMAPGLGEVTFADFFNALGLGDNGTVAFCARLAGTGVDVNNEMSIWIGAPGDLSLLVREGDAVPGFPAGVFFDSFSASSYETGPSVNPYGHTAFLARLRGTGITTANDDTLWAQDGDGLLRLVIREGSSVPVSGGGTGAISVTNPNLFVPFTFHSMGGFASTTRLVFAAETTNGTSEGIYAAAVPDETTAPVVRISGSKSRVTRATKVRITGTSSDNRLVAKVEAKVGRLPYRRVAGTVRWFFKAKLKSGSNRIFVRALDAAGNTSRIVVVKVKKA